MMERIMNDARVTTALDQTEAPAKKVFSMPIPATQQWRAARFIAALSLGLAATAIGCTQADRLSAISQTGASVPSFAPVVQEVMPAVVNVSAIQRVNKAAVDEEKLEGVRSRNQVALRDLPPAVLDELLRRFSDPRDRRAVSGPKVASVALGSGFIIDPSGYV